MKLKSSTGGETIGDGESSEVFYVNRGIWHLYITGTPSTATITLAWSRKKDGTFVTYVADDVTGTPTNQAFSATQVASSSVGYHRVYVDSGMYFKMTDDGSGTGTSWQIDVNGDHVQPAPIS